MYNIPDTTQNPYDFPTPAPGEVVPVPMSSFEKMNESEECDPQDMASTPDEEEEAAEGNFRLGTIE